MANLVRSLITNADALYYTAPAGGAGALIQGITVTGLTAVLRTVRVHLVPPAGAAALGNAIFYDMPIQANGVANWGGRQSIAAGGTIRAQADALNAITLHVEGVEL